MSETASPTRQEVLDAIASATDKAGIRTAQRLARLWLHDQPNDVEISQAVDSLTAKATQLLSRGSAVDSQHSDVLMSLSDSSLRALQDDADTETQAELRYHLRQIESQTEPVAETRHDRAEPSLAVDEAVTQTGSYEPTSQSAPEIPVKLALEKTPQAGNNAANTGNSPESTAGNAANTANAGGNIASNMDSFAVQLIDQLKSENGFLRTQLEEANRNAAELRAALREAQKIHAKALPAPSELEQPEPPTTDGVQEYQREAQTATLPTTTPIVENMPEAPPEPQNSGQPEAPPEPQNSVPETAPEPQNSVPDAPPEPQNSVPEPQNSVPEPQNSVHPVALPVEPNRVSPALYGAQLRQDSKVETPPAATLQNAPPPPSTLQQAAESQPQQTLESAPPLVTPWYPPMEPDSLWKRFKVWLIGG